MAGEFRIERRGGFGFGARTHTLLTQVERDTAARVAAAARANAPVLTGELRDSIEVEGTDVVARAAHAPHVELGTVDQAAQPFLSPAVEAERGEFPAAIAAAIEQGARA